MKWFGVFHPKTNELFAVEETEAGADAIAIELAGKGKKPWPVKPVLVTEFIEQ